METASPIQRDAVTTKTKTASLDLTTETSKLRNDTLMFQQHHGESLFEAWTRFKDLLQKVPHHGIDLWLQVQIFYDHVNPVTRRTIDQSAGGPAPQPQALGTTFKARVRDYMTAHTERMERFENTIFKQRKEINGGMIEIFGLLKELTTSRTPKKVLIREKAQFPVTKNAEAMNGAENGAGNESIKTYKNDEAVEASGSQLVAYYLKHKINGKLIKGLVKNNIFNNSLSGTRVGKKNGKAYKVLPGGPVYDTILKKKITKKEDIRGNFEIPCSIGDLKHVNAFIDQGSDVNVMPYSTYMKLTNKRPTETNIRLSLASHSYIYPLGITKDVLVEVVEHVFPVDFVILNIKENEKRPFILGTLFLTTAKAIIKFDIGTISLRSGKSKVGVRLFTSQPPPYTVEDGIGTHNPWKTVLGPITRGRRYWELLTYLLTFYKECLELGPEYVTGLDEDGEVT
ncbi:MAK10-like protein [Tanacetum coccineum]